MGIFIAVICICIDVLMSSFTLFLFILHLHEVQKGEITLKRRGQTQMLSPDVAADTQMSFVSSTCANGKFEYKTDGTIWSGDSGTPLCLSVESAPFFSESNMNGKKLMLRSCKYSASCNNDDKIVFLLAFS